MLISAYFVYQTKGHIDAHAIERLGVILKVAEQLRGTRVDSTTDKPNFLWLIRDHQLKLTTTPKQEMNSKLGDRERTALERCFVESDCFPLPRPVDKESDLQHVEQMPYDALKVEFRDEYVVLERQVFNAVAAARRLSGRVVTGATIAQLVTLYAAALTASDGVVADLTALPTQWQMVAKMSGERAYRMALAHYDERMKVVLETLLPMASTKLASIHASANDEAMSLFAKEAQCDDLERPSSEVLPYLQSLRSSIATWHDVALARQGIALVERRLVAGTYQSLFLANAQG